MLTVIGCGNLNRKDDGVGVVIAQRLQARLRKHPVPGVQVFDCGTAGVDVMFKARGSTALIIIDASRTESEPGAIYEVPGEVLARPHEPTYSLHDFRWDHALAAGRRIFKDEFPEDVRVWLIEAKTLEYGLELSEEVERAADDVYQRALSAMAAHAAVRHEGAESSPIEIRRGSIRIPRGLYVQYFEGREGALLMADQGRIQIIPIDQLAGGLLVKQRNLQGDRVIHATEFLREHGVEGFEGEVEVSWDSGLGSLSFPVPDC